MRYAGSSQFIALEATAKALAEDLAKLRYCVLIKGSSFKVRKYDGEQDYSEEVTETFKKFQQGAVKDYLASFHESVEVNSVEAQVLEYVALLYPEEFARLDNFLAQTRPTPMGC